MDSVGALLKTEREKQHKTVQQLARETRISKTTLVALEEGNSDLLPPPAYVRGFLRLYADELGIDPDQVLQMYEEELREIPKWEPQKELKEPPPSFIRRHGLSVCFGAVVLAAAAMIVYLGLLYTPLDKEVVLKQVVPRTEAPRSEQPPPESAAEPAEPPRQETPAPAAGNQTAQPEGDAVEPEPLEEAAGPEPGPAPEVIAGYETGKPFTVKLAAEELAWIRVVIDEKEPFEVMLYPGETYTRQAQVMELRIGNPGGVTLYYNGTALDLKGDPDRPVDLQFPEAAQQLEPEE